MMDSRYTLEPVFLLHRRRYRDSSLLLELFTPLHGRVAAISRGALSAKRNKTGLLQPFSPIFTAWTGKGEIKTVTRLEPRSAAISLRGQALYCGFYVNELLMYLTQRHDPQITLFSIYENTLLGLANNTDIQAVLRRFEVDLLTEIGYQMELTQEVATGQPLVPDAWYEYEVESGPVPSIKSRVGAVQGATLLNLHTSAPMTDQQRVQAKNLMRSVLNFHLDGRTLKSKELFK